MHASVLDFVRNAAAFLCEDPLQASIAADLLSLYPRELFVFL